MSDLVEFLRARLAEDERAARAADAVTWKTTRDLDDFSGDSLSEYTTLRDAEGETLVNDLNGDLSAEEIDHIARHDPARVLRGVERDRLILAEHVPEQGIPYDGGDENDPSTWVPCCSTCQVGVVHEGDWPCLHLRLLALPYADHPDYDPAWRV